MSKKDEAMKLALGELQAGKVGIAMQILREALAEQPAQQALDKKAENARELGLDYEPVWNNLPPNKDVEDALRLKRLSQLAEQPAQYSDIVSDGGMDPRNKFDKPAQQEPVKSGEGASAIVTITLPAQQEPVPCCGKYKTCTQACTPRGRFLGKRDALAEQPAQQEPVAHVMFRQDEDGLEPIMFYGPGTAPDPATLKDRFVLKDVWLSPPAQRTWVGLSTDEIYDMYNEPRSDAEMVEFARAIEAKLREKNT